MRHALGFVAHKFGKNKEQYVRRGQVLFQDGEIAMIDCPEQRNEFKSFSAFEAVGLGSEKRINYCAPVGEFDDMVASFLHLAPTLTIVGRQEPVPVEPPPQPMLDEQGKTTLALWAEDSGVGVPFTKEDATEEISWDDVVMPER